MTDVGPQRICNMRNLNTLQKQNSLDLLDEESPRPLSGAKSFDQEKLTIKITSPREGNLSLLRMASQESERKPGLRGRWKSHGLFIITRVARFIYQLKTQSEMLKVKIMNYHTFSFINDHGSDYTEFKRTSSIVNIGQVLSRTVKSAQQLLAALASKVDKVILSNIGVLQPDSKIKVAWDLAVVIFIVINIFYIPMSLSFKFDLGDSFIQFIFETLPSYVFIIEILLNFNTAYYSQGVIHTQKSDIVYNYVKGNLRWDLMIVLPFLMAQFNIPYIRFVLLLRVTRVRSMIQNVEELLNIEESYQALIDLIKLVYFILFVAHMCACAWHLIGTIELEVYQDQNSWLVYYSFYNQDWYYQYVASLYWSVITTLTVGYGDIVPQTTVERIFVIFTSLIICGVFGYTISQIGEILKNLDEKQLIFKQAMKTVNQYIKSKQLNTQLSLKVKKYFEYQLELQKLENSLEEQVMKKLTPELRQEILVDIYRKILKRSQFISGNLSESIIQKLCCKVTQKNYAPGDQIISINEHSECIYFIINGLAHSYSKSIALNIKTQGKQLATFKTGAVLGEREFLINSLYTQNYYAATYTQVACLKRTDFINILKESGYYVKFNEIKENIQFSSNLGRTCEICKWTHGYEDCPFVFYKPNKWKIMRDANKSDNSNRVPHQRKNQKNNMTKKYRSSYLEPCLQYIIQNGCVLEDQMTDSYIFKLGLGYLQDVRDPDDISIHSQGSFQEEISPLKPPTGEVKRHSLTKSTNLFDTQNKASIAIDHKFEKLKENQLLRNFYSTHTSDTHTGNILMNTKKNLEIIDEDDGDSKQSRLSNIQFSHDSQRQHNHHRHTLFMNMKQHESGKSPELVSPKFLDHLSGSKMDNYDIVGFERYYNFDDYFPTFNIDIISNVLNERRFKQFKNQRKRAFQDKIKSFKKITHSSGLIKKASNLQFY